MIREFTIEEVNIKAAELLDSAVNFYLQNENSWCQGAWARDKNNEICYFDDVNAVSFCMSGILLKIVSFTGKSVRNNILTEQEKECITLTKQAVQNISLKLGRKVGAVAQFNDHPQRNKFEIINLFREIKKEFSNG